MWGSRRTKQVALYKRTDPELVKKIKTITGGPNKFGTSHSSQKRHVREARPLKELRQHGQLVEIIYQAKQHTKLSIEFTDADI